jgi:hypothetical protein
VETVFTAQAGMSDLMEATRTETRRIIEAAEGDPIREYELLLDKLASLQLINSDESKHLVRLYQRVVEAGDGKCPPAEAYFEARAHRDSMLADGHASPLAVTLASATVGSYGVTQGSDGGPVIVAYAKTFTGIGTAAGAIIGGLLGGGAGATIGGLVGGALGGIIDGKKSKT